MGKTNLLHLSYEPSLKGIKLPKDEEIKFSISSDEEKFIRIKKNNDYAERVIKNKNINREEKKGNNLLKSEILVKSNKKSLDPYKTFKSNQRNTINSENSPDNNQPIFKNPITQPPQIELPPILKKAAHKIILQVLAKKNRVGENFVFYEDFSIGLAKQNQMKLVLNTQRGIHSDIAEVHCTVKLNEEGIFELEDCDSEFGTFYRITPAQKYILEEGQIFCIGKLMINIGEIENEKMTFEVIEGDLKGENIKIDGKKFQIGSAKKNDLRIKTDKWISNLHCIIKNRKNGGFAIIDNDSTNGLLLKIFSIFYYIFI